MISSSGVVALVTNPKSEPASMFRVIITSTRSLFSAGALARARTMTDRTAIERFNIVFPLAARAGLGLTFVSDEIRQAAPASHLLLSQLMPLNVHLQVQNAHPRTPRGCEVLMRSITGPQP